MLFKQIYTGGNGEQLTFKVSEGNLSNPAIFDIILPFSLECETQSNVENMLTSLGLMVVTNTNESNSAVVGFAQI